MFDVITNNKFFFRIYISNVYFLYVTYYIKKKKINQYYCYITFSAHIVIKFNHSCIYCLISITKKKIVNDIYVQKGIKMKLHIFEHIFLLYKYNLFENFINCIIY